MSAKNEPYEAPVAPPIPSADEQPDCCGLDNWEPSEDPCKWAITELPADKGNAGITDGDHLNDED